MNCFVLEGIALYVFLIAVVLLLIISLLCMTKLLMASKRNFALVNLLINEKHKVKNLARENFILKIKCGEFEFDEEK
ncbi:MAG: hypothetical protein IKJ93_02065 [Clostridia bacterium]|nr:hypothetical protein [Clostridia bacterium]